MERVIVASLRGFACVLTLAGLAACNDGSSGSDAVTPIAQQPTTPPTRPANPAPPTNPTEPSNPTQPSDPTQPADGTNVAPQINGSPASQVEVGHSFNFTPNVADADGDALTFSIESKPSWASFDSSTGHLWGTPSDSDVGSHEDIAISVSDGEHVETLPQFAVNVVEQSNGNGSLSLSWEPPTENTDGSALTNLKGYKIHYGNSSGSYDQTVTIDNAGISSYVLENLAAGTYYIAISAVTTSGAESDLSGEAHKAI